MEEARLHLDEPSIHRGNLLPRDPIDFGLAMQARLRLAMMLELAGHRPVALELYKANIAYETRVDPGSYKRQMFSAIAARSAAGEVCGCACTGECGDAAG